MTSPPFTVDGIRRLDDSLRGYTERRQVAGFVTALYRHGESIITSTGVQDLDTDVPMASDTLFRIASMTKPILAVLAMQLVDEDRLALDDAVGKWLPELANPRVLRSVGSALDDTVPAERAITVRDLMRFTAGFGAIMTGDGSYPIQLAIQEQGVGPGPFPSSLDPDAWIANLGSLPLAHQPGADWLYHTGSDALGVLIERLCGQTLETLFGERIFGPLGMTDTSFSVPEGKLHRFSTSYRIAESGGLEVVDSARGSAWANPSFRSGGGGLVSTAPDYLRFGRMLLNGGQLDGVRVISAEAVGEITHDQISAGEKANWPSYRAFQGENGWGYGLSVTLEPGPLGHAAGTYGWTGGWNTHWCNDPENGLVGIILSQRLMGGPNDMEISGDFWRGVYAALAV